MFSHLDQINDFLELEVVGEFRHFLREHRGRLTPLTETMQRLKKSLFMADGGQCHKCGPESGVRVKVVVSPSAIESYPVQSESHTNQWSMPKNLLSDMSIYFNALNAGATYAFCFGNNCVRKRLRLR